LSPSPLPYAATWLQDDDLATLQARIHDGVPVDDLAARGRRYRDLVFDTFPAARPDAGGRVMELGSGVGWIMEAVLERFSPGAIVGLDISPNMVRRAQERFQDARASFVLYDGLRMPFADASFETIYSVATLQHVEKHVVFLLLEEMHRIITRGGHAIVHLLSVDYIPHASVGYSEECWNHVRGTRTHWHHYYSFDELFVLLSKVLGVTDLDIRPMDGGWSFLVHFSKGAGQPYARNELPDDLYRNRTPSPTG
jgi:SAM-dependent methyltransferase